MIGRLAIMIFAFFAALVAVLFQSAARLVALVALVHLERDRLDARSEYEVVGVVLRLVVLQWREDHVNGKVAKRLVRIDFREVDDGEVCLVILDVEVHLGTREVEVGELSAFDRSKSDGQTEAVVRRVASGDSNYGRLLEDVVRLAEGNAVHLANQSGVVLRNARLSP
jgi:hypothetical protein